MLMSSHSLGQIWSLSHPSWLPASLHASLVLVTWQCYSVAWQANVVKSLDCTGQTASNQLEHQPDLSRGQWEHADSSMVLWRTCNHQVSSAHRSSEDIVYWYLYWSLGQLDPSIPPHKQRWGATLRVVNLWNYLPQRAVEVESLSIFKNSNRTLNYKQVKGYREKMGAWCWGQVLISHDLIKWRRGLTYSYLSSFVQLGFLWLHKIIWGQVWLWLLSDAGIKSRKKNPGLVLELGIYKTAENINDAPESSLHRLVEDGKGLTWTQHGPW